MLTGVALGALIGLVLALTGAGGGVLSIPLLVFVMHLSVQQAAPVGLLAVFMASLLGALLGLRQGVVRYRAAALMGVMGMVVAPLGLLLAQRLPNRPLLVAFAMVLMYSAWRSLRGGARGAGSPTAAPCLLNPHDQRLTWTLPCARALAGTGLIAGLLSGLLGVGGGFVIIPALSRYTDLTLRSVQATSMAVIALVSLSGVSSAALHGALSWDIALPFTVGAVVALLVGRQLASRLNPVRLNQIFAWFCVGVSLLMLSRAAGLMPS